MSKVISVSRSSDHNFSKEPVEEIELITGEGVRGDAHCGKSVKHRSRVKRDPTTPNLRQVHLISYELIMELRDKGFRVDPSSLGENITTDGIELLSLPKDTTLTINKNVRLQVTGLRNPCSQLDDFQGGLMSALLDRDENGNLIRKAGIMSIVLKGGSVRPGDTITVELPPEPHEKLERV